ncbi:hypothetical protein PIB30_068276, partial [Stylosanthes scabra]|nr:hypothetical protein [Stylosanthes scabra]
RLGTTPSLSFPSFEAKVPCIPDDYSDFPTPPLYFELEETPMLSIFVKTRAFDFIGKKRKSNFKNLVQHHIAQNANVLVLGWSLSPHGHPGNITDK